MARILLVDDEPMNLELLHAHLGELGHEMVDVSSGEAALERAHEADFDLVLLDVMLPGIDGFETASRLKRRAAERGEFLPIIMVTALNDTESRRRGLKVGADEFLSKPIDAVEVHLRIANLIALRQDRLALQQRNDRLIELQAFKDEMAALIIHDLRTPASVVLANLHYAIDLVKTSPDPAQLNEALDDARDGCRRLIRLLANLLDVARAEDNRLVTNREPLDLSMIIAPLVQSRMATAQARQLKIDMRLQPGCVAPIDADLVGRIVENVLDNAMRYTPRGGSITLVASREPADVEVRIGNTGPSIPPESRSAIFEKYGQVKFTDAGTQVNSGLGLYFCRLAVEAHGGKIWIEADAEMPTIFVMSLPTSENGLSIQ